MAVETKQLIANLVDEFTFQKPDLEVTNPQAPNTEIGGAELTNSSAVITLKFKVVRPWRLNSQIPVQLQQQLRFHSLQ